MKTIKLVLIVLALVFTVILAFGIVGVIMHFVQYLFALALLLLVGVVAVKVLRRPDEPPQLAPFTDHARELERVQRTLDEYKRKQLPK
jgi:uncharacterized membrane-anchored protein YhcB (DUF1043 family)